MSVAATAPIPQASLADPSPPLRAGGAASSDDWDFSFHDLVSIANPLQHFPIVSTLYRKLTGDTIKPFERVAGDTLYGGWIGLVSSVANLIFEKSTGKDFGDTVLAMIDGGGDSNPAVTNIAIANALPPSSAIATPAPRQPDSPKSDAGALALVSSMASDHIETNLSQRALYAYRRSMEISPATADLRPAF
jgi:hypothetical protein